MELDNDPIVRLATIQTATTLCNQTMESLKDLNNLDSIAFCHILPKFESSISISTLKRMDLRISFDDSFHIIIG